MSAENLFLTNMGKMTMGLIQKTGKYEESRFQRDYETLKQHPLLHLAILTLGFVGAGLGAWIGLKLVDAI